MAKPFRNRFARALSPTSIGARVPRPTSRRGRSLRERSKRQLLLEALENRSLLATINLFSSGTEIQENPALGSNAVTLEARTDIPVVGDQTVRLNVTGDGIEGNDYLLSSATITIFNGQTSGSATLTSIDDDLLEIREIATVSMEELSAGLTPGLTTRVEVDIRDSRLPDLEVADMRDLRDALPQVNWVGDEPCVWGGEVSCGNDHVIGLSISSDTFDGPAPPPPTNLDELLALVLRGPRKDSPFSSGPNGERGFSGPISDFNLEQWPTLRVVQLEGNQFSGTLADLSSSLNEHPSLVFLNIGTNDLTGPIPANFLNDPLRDNLQRELSRNRLSGTLPANGQPGGNWDISGNMLEGVLPSYVRPGPVNQLDYNMFDVVNTPPTGGDESWRETQTVPPTNVQVSSPSAGVATLTWTPIAYQEDGGHYEVLSSTTPGGPYVSRGNTSASGAKAATGLTVTGLPGGTNYFVVRTFTPRHERNPNDLTSVPSAEVSANLGPSTLDLTAPDPSAAEGPTDTATFRLTRDNPGGSITATLAIDPTSTTADGSEYQLAIDGGAPIDTSSGTFTVTFPDGRDTLDITLAALVESVNEAEAAEQVRLLLQAGQAGNDYFVGESSATATIAANGFLVTRTVDGGNGSLRLALANANAIPGPDTIRFGDGSAIGGVNFLDATPDIIALAARAMVISDDVTIVGSGKTLLTIDAQNQSRIFTISDFASAGTVELQGMTLANGNAQGQPGGAIWNQASLTVEEVLFVDNAAGGGGAINSVGQLQVLRSTFRGNSSGVDGGALEIEDRGSAAITDSTFYENVAVNAGGAIANFGSLDMVNSTLYANRAVLGAGIFMFPLFGNDDPRATLTNTTITSNTAISTSGGVSNSNGTLTIVNSLLVGNAAPTNPDLFGDLTPQSTNNLIGINNAEAGIDFPAFNGGPTITIGLLPDSPAINAGTPVGAPATDQRGIARDTLPDIGAFELSSASVVGAANAVQVAGDQIIINVFLENFGDQTAGDLSLVNDLDTTFGAGNYTLAAPPERVSGPDTVIPSGAFDGSGTPELLAPGSTMAAGTTAQIRFRVTLTRLSDQGLGQGVYANQSVVRSSDPSGVTTIDRSTPGADPDPNGNDIPSEAGEDNATNFTVSDITSPTVEIVEVTPDPRRTPVNSVMLQFSEDVSGVDIGDLTLTRNGVLVDLSGLTVVPVTPSQYTVDLSTVTSLDGDYELRLIHLGSEIFDSASNPLETDSVDRFTIDTVAPQVEQIRINEGDAQRSMVSQISVFFSEIVSVDVSSFAIINTTTNETFVPALSLEEVNGKTIAQLQFSATVGSGAILSDGNYRITIIDSQTTDRAGNRLDGDEDGQAGGSAVDQFFRLFGDIDGDRDVDRRDFLFFRRSYGRSPGDPLFNPAFDHDDDGDVDRADFIEFRKNYRRILNPDA